MCKVIYSPIDPPKGHIKNGRDHEVFGKYLETITSKKFSLAIKGLLVIVLGYLFSTIVQPTIIPSGTYEIIQMYLVPIFLLLYALYFFF